MISKDIMKETYKGHSFIQSNPQRYLEMCDLPQVNIPTIQKQWVNLNKAKLIAIKDASNRYQERSNTQEQR